MPDDPIGHPDVSDDWSDQVEQLMRQGEGIPDLIQLLRTTTQALSDSLRVTIADFFEGKIPPKTGRPRNLKRAVRTYVIVGCFRDMPNKFGAVPATDRKRYGKYRGVHNVTAAYLDMPVPTVRAHCAAVRKALLNGRMTVTVQTLPPVDRCVKSASSAAEPLGLSYTPGSWIKSPLFRRRSRRAAGALPKRRSPPSSEWCRCAWA